MKEVANEQAEDPGLLQALHTKQAEKGGKWEVGRSTKFGSKEECQKTLALWNKTVNVIRRAAGLEPFSEEIPIESIKTGPITKKE